MRKLLVALVAVVVVASGAVATLLLLDDAADSTGADSPETAAAALVGAVRDGDVLGVLDLLPAGERDALVDGLAQLTDAGHRLGFLADGFGLDAVTGVDVAVPQPVFRSRTLTDGVAAVDVATSGVGVATFEVDLPELLGPLADLLESAGFRTNGDVPTIGVVEDDGWRPSLVATAALLTDDDTGRAVEADGAGAPLGAVADLLDAIADDDPRAVLALLDPAEAAPWQALGAVPDSFGEHPVQVAITDLEEDDLGDGYTRIVPTGVRIEDGDTTVNWVDGCVTVERNDAETERCQDDLPTELDDLLRRLEPLRTGVVTVERDGEFFVSPLRTALDVAVAVTDGLEPGDLDEGSIVVEALTGGLGDVLRDLVDGIDADLEPDDRPNPGPDDDADDDPANDVDVPLRTATGATGPGGALLVGDVVDGRLDAGGTVAFTVIASGGEGYIGAQATGDADLTIVVTDAATGEELDHNDDFVGQDPEAFVRATEGQRLDVEVAGFDDDQAGGFVVYYEQ